MKSSMIDVEYERLGKACREAEDGNLLIGSFAAELIGESYPFRKSMCDVVFKRYSDLDLGKRFVKWMEEKE